MDEPKIRYFPEKFLESSLPASVAAFSEGCSYLALARGCRISVVKISNTKGNPVYFQDGGSEVTALLWLSDNVLIAGYSDGMFVTTRITLAQIGIQGQALGLRAFRECKITAILKGASLNRLALASGDTVQLWRSSWVPWVRSDPPRWVFHKALTLPAHQPIFALSWSYRSPKDLFIVHPQGVVEWDVKNSKQSELFKQPVDSQILGISWAGRRLISAVQQGERTQFADANLDAEDVTDPNDQASVAFAHGDRLILLGSSCSDRLVLWDVRTSNKEALGMVHRFCPTEPKATLRMISKINDISKAPARIGLWKTVHTFTSIRGSKSMIWEAAEPRFHAQGYLMLLSIAVVFLCLAYVLHFKT
ncbi:hypothetical protein BDZ89DRAFT_1051644 [Hymenopellis radicata]|nr:hypothetical protein BDZ89DRAFT_1051644 [Hymenopellis radicata]